MIRSRRKRKANSNPEPPKSASVKTGLAAIHYILFNGYPSFKKTVKIESEYHYKQNNQLK